MTNKPQPAKSMQDSIPRSNLAAANSYDYNFNPSDPSESLDTNSDAVEMSDMSVPVKQFDYD